jgi:hypothetical protein
MRWFCALVVGGILSVFAFLLLTGHYLEEGPVIASVTADHGVHAGDVLVIAGWTVGVLALLLLVRTSTRVRTP